MLNSSNRNSVLGRSFVVGMILLSFYFLTFASFKSAGIVLVIDLVAVGTWRALRHSEHQGWFAIRAKWLDLVTVFGFAIALLTLILIVPTPN